MRSALELPLQEQLELLEALAKHLVAQGLLKGFSCEPTNANDTDQIMDYEKEKDATENHVRPPARGTGIKRKTTDDITSANVSNPLGNGLNTANDFIQPKKPAKIPAINKSESLQLQNVFSPLENEELQNMEEEEDDEIDEQEEEQEDQRRKATASKKQEKKENKQTKHAIAPIIVREKDKWTRISSQITKRKISYTKARNIYSGIEVQPSSEDDYRALRKYLTEVDVQFHTYELKSEKPLKVVIKGIPIEVKEEEVDEYLKEKSYPISKIVRMRNRGNPSNMVLIEINKDYKSIYDLKSICGLMVEVEPLRRRNSVVQCHRCQLFGHIQKNCNAQFMCMKCGENHSTHECTKPATIPPKCSNCEGEHLSISRRCPKNPNNPSQRKEERPVNVWNKREEERHNKQNKETNLKVTIQEMIEDFNKKVKALLNNLN